MMSQAQWELIGLGLLLGMNLVALFLLSWRVGALKRVSDNLTAVLGSLEPEPVVCDGHSCGCGRRHDTEDGCEPDYGEPETDEYEDSDSWMEDDDWGDDDSWIEEEDEEESPTVHTFPTQPPLFKYTPPPSKNGDDEELDDEGKPIK